ncbi:toll/interleukin-1 receptor domain-containing protein [Vibrio harveyi]|uniref:toll/interleukin-1 receptor domain-containing protein n=1 Tax=Vibrio harveyi TaxID=669 RepID=UPI00069E693D|nr:toll/interleukin-1 receptor domain-containing protein [Vibrio harveyi]KNY44646.1 hypothetical protein AKG93_07135 [Vibrio harveyi]
MAGINRALPQPIVEKYAFSKTAPSTGENKPCIFLSHISIDKKAVQDIADYIMEKADIDVYLDIHDEELQEAVGKGNAEQITALIERGIDKSTHTMCLISQKTKSSWWVPYELGYAKRSGKKISSLKLKGDVELPDFLKVGEIIYGTKSLNDYIKNEIRDFKSLKSHASINESLESHTDANHPLDGILDWRN